MERLNWFLGVLAIELWVVAWLVAFAREIARWWRRRRGRHPTRPA